VLDEVEETGAGLTHERLAEKPAEQADVVAQRSIDPIAALLVSTRSRRAHRSSLDPIGSRP